MQDNDLMCLLLSATLRVCSHCKYDNKSVIEDDVTTDSVTSSIDSSIDSSFDSSSVATEKIV